MEKRYLAIWINVVVQGQVKSENSSLPVAVRVSKTRVLKRRNVVDFSFLPFLTFFNLTMLLRNVLSQVFIVK